MGLPSMVRKCDALLWATTAGSVTALKTGAFGEPQRQEESLATKMGCSQLLQLTSLAKEGLCTCLIWREGLQVMAVLL